MHRIQPQGNPRLEALLDERDHIRIKISLLAGGDAEAMVKLQSELHSVDKRIAELERASRNGTL